MQLVTNWQIAITFDDCNRDINLKKDLVFLICKYLRNKDGSIPSQPKVMRLPRKQLYIVWNKYKPKDFRFGENR